MAHIVTLCMMVLEELLSFALRAFEFEVVYGFLVLLNILFELGDERNLTHPCSFKMTFQHFTSLASLDLSSSMSQIFAFLLRKSFALEFSLIT